MTSCHFLTIRHNLVMSTMTRKQREIQQREQRILEVAREQLVRDGYHGLSMDRIAQSLEYAKGTIYNHFPCKEEIMLALANEALEKRTQMFRRAAQLSGRTRERLAAIGAAAEHFARAFPHHFAVEQLIRSASIWDKTSERRRNAMSRSESCCMEIVGGVVRDAVSCGDLEMRAGATPEEIVFGLWSMSFGAYSIIATSESLSDLGIGDPYETVRQNMNVMVDGLGWQPLSHEIDYTSLYERIQQQVFAEDATLAATE
jgi:AcrR family transcriptional regulator